MFFVYRSKTKSKVSQIPLQDRKKYRFSGRVTRNETVQMHICIEI